MNGLLLLAGFFFPPLVDLQGDPLPPTVVARLGSVRFRHPNGVEAIAYSPDSKTLISGGRDGMVRIWEVASGKEIRCLKGHAKYVNSVAISPDGRLVEYAELPEDVHPFFVGTQSHPEFRSRPTRPHPLFSAFIGAALRRASASGAAIGGVSLADDAMSVPR